MYDILVVGGGPAGMTAALYAARSGKSVLILEKNGFGGQITNSPNVENYPGIMQMSGVEFADRLLEQVLAQGAEAEIETVSAVRNSGDRWLVFTEDGTEYAARTLILAVGVTHRRLGVVGEEELIGKGVSFCAVCDGEFYRNKSVVVAGGGNTALQEALFLSDICRKVTVVPSKGLRGEAALWELLHSRENVCILTGNRVVGLGAANGVLTSVRLRSFDGAEREECCDGVFVAVGLIPENAAFRGLAALDENGYFDSDERCLTQSAGVFVAGDCRRKALRQLTTAVSDGASAAVAACRYLDSVLLCVSG